MPVISEEIDELAEVLTEAFFDLGAKINDGEQPLRLEYKLGVYGEERGGGGFCRPAFHAWLANRLQEMWDAKT